MARYAHRINRYLIAMLAFIPSHADAEWVIKREVDSMTDKVEVTAELKGDGASLIILCAGDARPLLIFRPDIFLGGGGSRYELRDFVHRFDDKPSETSSWKYNDHYATAYNVKAVKEFISKMLVSSRLRVRALRYDNTIIDREFDLSGTREALTDVATTCD